MGSIERRIGILFLAFMSLLGIALVRAIYVGSFQAGTLRKAAFTQQVSTVTIPAERGSITDRSGIEFAISESADDVVADPYLIKDPAGTAQKLAPLLGKPETTVLAELVKPHTGFVYLARLLPGDRATEVQKLQVDGKRIDGLTFIPKVTRVYPRTWEAAQVLGGVHVDGHGYSGVELADNSALSGTDGTRRIVNDAIGQPISINEVRPMRPGKAVALTIDAPLQDYVEQVLAGVGQQYSPRGATAIVMDPNTGAVLALANWPRVDANNPTAVSNYAIEDRAIAFNYEPGSTFKAITVAGALTDGVVAPATQFNVPAVLQVADRQIHDAEPHGDVTFSVADIIRKSSNIGADEIGMKLGATRFDYWVHRFGFGARTGIDVPGEEQGIVLRHQQYSGSSMGNLPMGQGESVTPIQMATAYSAIANGGILRPPHIVQSIGGKPVPTPAGHRIITQLAASEMRDMLQGVFADGGTASGAAIPHWALAGKTGTANEVINGQYSSTAYAASFIGFVPVSHPKLLVAVMVDRPQGAIYGGSVAAPAFQKIVGWAVPHFGISPS